MLLSFGRRRKPAANDAANNSVNDSALNSGDPLAQTSIHAADPGPESEGTGLTPAAEAQPGPDGFVADVPPAQPEAQLPEIVSAAPSPVSAKAALRPAARAMAARLPAGRSKADLAPFQAQPRADAAPGAQPAEDTKAKKADGEKKKDEHADGDHPGGGKHDADHSGGDHHDDKGHAHSAHMRASSDAPADPAKKADGHKPKDGVKDHPEDEKAGDGQHDVHKDHGHDEQGHHHPANTQRLTAEADAPKDGAKKADGAKPKDGKDDHDEDGHPDDAHHDDAKHPDHGHHQAKGRAHEIAADELLRALSLLAEEPREPVHVTGRAGEFRIVADPAWSAAHDAGVLPDPYRSAAQALRSAGRRRDADAMLQALSWRQLMAEWPELLTPGAFFLGALVTAAIGDISVSAVCYGLGVALLVFHAVGRLFPFGGREGRPQLRVLSGDWRGFGTLTWPLRVAVFLLSGGGFRPMRAIYALGAVYLAGVLVFSLAHERGLMFAPAKAGGTVADGVVVKSSRDGQGNLPMAAFDPWLYSADILLPMIDLNQRTSWQPMAASALGGCKEVAGLSNAWPSSAVAHAAMGSISGCVRHELRPLGGHELFAFASRVPGVETGAARLWVEDALDSGWAGLWLVFQAVAGLILAAIAVLGVAGLLGPRGE